MVNKLLKRLAASQSVRAFFIIFVVLLAAYLIPHIINRSQNPILQKSGLTSQTEPGIFSGQSTIDPNDGFTSQALGNKAADSWLSGDVPYWNHYEGVGAPLAGEMQSAALFPLIPILHLSNGFIYFHFLLQLIAGFAAYLFFKKLKLRFSIAVLGGVLFALNGAFAWLTNAPFNAVAFLPLLLLGMEYAIASAANKKKGGWALIAIALGLSLYSGFPETAFINAIFAYGWGAVRLFGLDSKYRKSLIYKITLGSAVGLLLAAPALVAFLGYLPYAMTGGHEGNAFANFGLPGVTLPALFMPYIFGPIFGFVAAAKPDALFMFWSNVGGYITIPLLLLGIFGLYSKRPRGLKLYLSIFSLVVILKLYGFGPIAFLINLIPGMDQVAFYRYSIPVLSFAMITLTMFGVEAFIKKEISKRKAIVITASMGLFTLLLALLSRKLLHQMLAFPSHRWWAIFSVLWALSILTIIILVFQKTKIKLIGIATLLVIDAFAMFVMPYFSLPKTSNIDTAPVTYLQKNIGLNRFYTLHPIQPNYGSYYDVASININDLPIPKKWETYIPKKLDSNAVPLIFTGYIRADATGPTALEEFSKNLSNYEEVGVKYLVADPGLVTKDFSSQNGLKLVFSDHLANIYELPNPKTYYEGPEDCVLTPQGRDALKANCSSAATIKRRELYMPGWSASANGTDKVVKAEGDIFQKIDIPKGESNIKFLYNPPHIGLAYVAFAIGVVALAAPVISREVTKIRKASK